MNVTELRKMSAVELQQELINMRQEQFNLRMQRGADQLANPSRFNQVRKEIARIKTIMHEKVENQ